MMMSSCQMNSSMMNNVSRSQNFSTRATNALAKPAGAQPTKSDAAVQAVIESSIKSYNSGGGVNQATAAQSPIGTILNQLV